MSIEQLKIIAQTLDARDCGCKVVWKKVYREALDVWDEVIASPPCPHSRAADHDYSLQDWADLLLLALPEEYEQPPPPDRPIVAAITRQARIATYRRRNRRNQSLWHQDDVWAQKEDNATPLKVAAASAQEVDGVLQRRRGKNGRTIARETITTEKDSA